MHFDADAAAALRAAADDGVPRAERDVTHASASAERLGGFPDGNVLSARKNKRGARARGAGRGSVRVRAAERSRGVRLRLRPAGKREEEVTRE